MLDRDKLIGLSLFILVSHDAMVGACRRNRLLRYLGLSAGRHPVSGLPSAFEAGSQEQLSPDTLQDTDTNNT